MVLVGFDTDAVVTTGGPSGFEYWMILDFEDLSGVLLHWDGSTWVDAVVQQGDARFEVGCGSFEMLLRPAALGGATKFNFKVGAASGAGDAQRFDFAPDDGSWLFEVKAPLVASGIDATFVSAAPKAGAVFQSALLRVTLSDGSSVVSNSYRCVATLGGKLLPGSGRGGCTLRLPRTAKGKRLKVVLFVTYGGTTDEYEPYVFKVR